MSNGTMFGYWGTAVFFILKCFWDDNLNRFLLSLLCWLVVPIAIIIPAVKLLSVPLDWNTMEIVDGDLKHKFGTKEVLLFLLTGLTFWGLVYSSPYDNGFLDEERDTLIVTSIILWLAALIPASIARNKGRHFFRWWFYGTLIWIVALIHSLIVKPTEATLVKKGVNKKCPHCAELIKAEAAVCRYCGNRLS